MSERGVLLPGAYGGLPTSLRASAGAFVLNAEGRLLLQRRADNGYWNLPGGGLEVGESITQACEREVREETGLIVEVVRLVGVYSDPGITTIGYPDGNRVQYLSCLFECRLVGGVLLVDAESLELGFFDCEDLPDPFAPFHRIRVSDALRREVRSFIR